ncbi:unnamed protein product [Linum trigynum]|uniref:Uncharacterized protein n=1 Tax=Linum trigynum TaxID=586398 RepID=A0AAV2CJB3_9ROSI
MAFTSSDDTFYSLKAEKADAIRKFHQQQNLFYFGRLLAASLLLLWSFKTLPFLTQMASAYVSVFGQQLCAFLVANAIVVFVYHFSTAAANNTIAAAVAVNSPSSPSPSSFRSDVCDEYVSLSSESRRRPALDGDVVDELPPPVEILPPPEDHAAAGSDLALTEAAAAGDGSTERRHRRTRSVVVASTTATEGGGNTDRHYKAFNAQNCEKKELRRSETVVVKARTPAAAASAAALGKSLSFNQARKSIEEMNNDEFNMTVESFIATKKRLLRDENIALFETDYDRRHVFAVAACPR